MRKCLGLRVVPIVRPVFIQKVGKWASKVDGDQKFVRPSKALCSFTR